MNINKVSDHDNGIKRNVGKVVTGILVGGVVGATVGLLMAPMSGQETRRKLTGQVQDARTKAKTAAGNVESKARALAKKASKNAAGVKKTTTRRKKATSTTK